MVSNTVQEAIIPLGLLATAILLAGVYFYLQLLQNIFLYGDPVGREFE